jgi:calcineurin-like phosphoesterase family protein
VRYFTSDFHLDHKNVIIYCNRPFTRHFDQAKETYGSTGMDPKEVERLLNEAKELDVQDMNRALIDAWNVVKPEDTVYHVGDFCFNANRALIHAAKLQGIKVNISGNHDKTFPNNEQWIAQYKNIGKWNAVHKELSLTLKDGTEVILNHFPYRPKTIEGVPSFDLKFNQHRPINEGKILIHGHMHCHYLKKDNMIDVGIDNTFKLYSEDEIIAMIKDQRAFIPSRLTEFYEKKKQDSKNNGENY